MPEQYYIDSYAELKRVKFSGLRSKLRNWALDLLAFQKSGQQLNLAMKTPRVQFLYIHHLFRDEEEKLPELLDFLEQQHQFISYSEAVNLILEQKVDRPYIVFSSDDGLKNNLKVASLLEERGISACFFINPFSIGMTDYEQVRSFCNAQLHFPPAPFMDWHDVERLQRGGHEIGSHTLKHINVAETEETLMREDLCASMQQLKANCGSVKHFAFPYGRFSHFSEAGRRAVFETGFQSCASAERGCHINHETPLKPESLLIRRDHIILGWKLPHILYFLFKNAVTAHTANNLFPVE